METDKALRDIVGLLKENELEMMHLYLEFSKKFILYRLFWHEIAEDEESHAAWVETLYSKIDAGAVNFSETRFPLDAIRHNIEYMRKIREKSINNDVTLLQALETAVSMENSMLENKFFDVFKGDSVELQIILEALRLGTQEHLRGIERVWKKEKLGSEFELLKT